MVTILVVVLYNRHTRSAVSNRWTGLLEWTTGMDFDLFFLFFFPPQELLYTLRNLFSLTLAHAGLACKVVLARAVPKQGVVTPIDSVQTPATGVKNWVKQSKPKIWKVKRSKAHR